MKKTKNKFTLLELLIVIAIIGILITILLPSLVNARQSAITAICLSNESQLTIGWMNFSTENNGKMVCPGEGSCTDEWTLNSSATDTLITQGALYPYVENKDVYLCPNESNNSSRRSYALPFYLAGHNRPGANYLNSYGPTSKGHAVDFLAQIDTPQSQFNFIEESGNTNGTSAFVSYPRTWGWWGDPVFTWLDWIPTRHRGANFAFADGHASYRKWSDSRTQTCDGLYFQSPNNKDVVYVLWGLMGLNGPQLGWGLQEERQVQRNGTPWWSEYDLP